MLVVLLLKWINLPTFHIQCQRTFMSCCVAMEMVRLPDCFQKSMYSSQTTMDSQFSRILYIKSSCTGTTRTLVAVAVVPTNFQLLYQKRLGAIIIHLVKTAVTEHMPQLRRIKCQIRAASLLKSLCRQMVIGTTVLCVGVSASIGIYSFPLILRIPLLESLNNFIVILQQSG